MQIAGGIQSGLLCLDHTVTLFLRYAYADTSAAIGGGLDHKCWDMLRPITPGMKDEFRYWTDRFKKDTSVLYRTPPWEIPIHDFDFDGFTDAGGSLLGVLLCHLQVMISRNRNIVTRRLPLYPASTGVVFIVNLRFQERPLWACLIPGS